ncbi:hypothetical protein Zmor_018584 [Zophobas morio]|uniref:Uncharacterized protein n=1 Tax=Zophobas morio TaxID=2755281 RepID=A0AA38ICT5_9CUCU|nr:hypothetical protein Zmor_018584 [Zophobas morio]
MVSFMRILSSILTLVTLTFEKIDTQENLLYAARDIRFFEGDLIDIKENNIIVITCNCPTLNFHLILKTKYVKRYTFTSKTHTCYTYEIASTSEKMQLVHNGEVVATAEDGLETMVLKCSSKYASWKILKNPCTDHQRGTVILKPMMGGNLLSHSTSVTAQKSGQGEEDKVLVAE